MHIALCTITPQYLGNPFYPPLSLNYFKLKASYFKTISVDMYAYHISKIMFFTNKILIAISWLRKQSHEAIFTVFNLTTNKTLLAACGKHSC